MNKKPLYSDEEIELFQALEDDIEKGSHQPLSAQELTEKKEFFKAAAIATIEKKTKKKSLNIRLFEDDIEK